MWDWIALAAEGLCWISGVVFVGYSAYSLIFGGPIDPVLGVDIANALVAMKKAGVDPKTMQIVIEAIKSGSIK